MLINIIITNLNALINYIPLFVLSILSLKLRLLRKKTFLMLGIYCILSLAASILFSYINVDNLFSKYYTFILLIPPLIFYLIIIEDNIARALFVFFSLFTYTMFIDLNSSMLSTSISASGNPLVINILIKIFLHAILFYPILKYVSIPFKKIIIFADKRYWYILSLFPILVSFSTMLLSKEGFISIDSKEFFTLNAVCIFSFGIFFLIFYMFKKTISIIDLQNNITSAKNQLELQREHYKQLSDSIMNLRKFQHDTKYHLLTLTELANNNNIEGIKSYLSDILKNKQELSLGTVCQHYSADAIIKHYIMLADAKNISVTTKINIPTDINIDSFDLSVIFGNCLENAIEACEKLPFESDRKIDIVSNIKNSYLIIKITNTYNGELISSGGVLLTSKNSEGHGLGLLNIKTAAEKYKGNVYIDTDGNKFIITIALFTGIKNRIENTDSQTENK